MAVWGYFPFDGRLVDPVTRADWAWAMAQWDTLAGAGSAVRLVVADRPYSLLDTADDRRDAAGGRFAACQAAGQLVVGRVYVAGGKLPFGTVGETFPDPLASDRLVAGVATQIAAWKDLYGTRIDGIYLDSGPTDCCDPAVPGSIPQIPQNYRDYVGAVRQLGYRLVVEAARYPDSQGWLRHLGADFLVPWQDGVASYTTKYGATDACRPDRPPSVPDWWAGPGTAEPWSRVHIVDDCRDAETMQKMASLAVGRGAATIWITRARADRTLGAVFDTLPPYWDEELALFADFARREEAKEVKDDADGKSAKDLADASKQVKDDADHKQTKDMWDAVADNRKHNKDEMDAKGHRKELESSSPLGVTSAPLGDDGTVDGASGRTFIRPHERPAVGEHVVGDPPDQDLSGGRS